MLYTHKSYIIKNRLGEILQKDNKTFNKGRTYISISKTKKKAFKLLESIAEDGETYSIEGGKYYSTDCDL